MVLPRRSTVTMRPPDRRRPLAQLVDNPPRLDERFDEHAFDEMKEPPRAVVLPPELGREVWRHEQTSGAGERVVRPLADIVNCLPNLDDLFDEDPSASTNGDEKYTPLAPSGPGRSSRTEPNPDAGCYARPFSELVDNLPYLDDLFDEEQLPPDPDVEDPSLTPSAPVHLATNVKALTAETNQHHRWSDLITQLETLDISLTSHAAPTSLKPAGVTARNPAIRTTGKPEEPIINAGSRERLPADLVHDPTPPHALSTSDAMSEYSDASDCDPWDETGWPSKRSRGLYGDGDGYGDEDADEAYFSSSSVEDVKPSQLPRHQARGIAASPPAGWGAA
jgi:hypothetical protein